MNKALEYFNEMVSSNQLDYQDEKPKCDLITNQLRAISCIENRALFDIKRNRILFVNKLIFIEDDLFIRGAYDYKVEDYGKTWREVREND